MRAKVILKDLKVEEGLVTLSQKLADISDLCNVRVNLNECSVSFNYETEEAAFKVLEKLRLMA